MNDIATNLLLSSDDYADLQSSVSSADTYAEWYDYRDIINRQDSIIENQNKTYDLVNQGFTFISFILVIFLVYTLIKNMIRKQVSL